MAMPNILIVDDEAYISTQLEEHLSSMGYNVVGMTSSGEASIEMAKSLHPDLILMDIVLPGKLDGIAAAQIIKEEQDIPVIFLTAYTDDGLIKRAKNVEPYGYIVKPFQKREIKAAIEVALYKKETEEALKRAHDELERRVQERTTELAEANEELQAEINERKQTEEMLRESEARWRTLVENAPDIILTVDREGRIMFINYAPAGLAVEDALGTNALDYVVPEHREAARQSIQRVFQSGDADSYEIAARGPHDTTSWYATRLGPIKRNGEVVAVMLITRDIIECKQAGETLRESEQRYRTLYESSQDGIAGGDMEGNILECNQAFSDMLGYTKEEIQELTYQQLTPKKWQKMEADIVKNQIAKRGYSDEYEKEYIRKDGTIFPVSCRVWLRKDEKGQPLGMWGIARDITVQKQAEEALRKREEELKIKTNSLEEVNAALRVLLKRRDEDRTELEEKILFNVKELVVPFLERLKKSQLDPKQLSYIDILESNLNNIISPFSRTLSTKYLNLTPTEIQVANLIKEGKSTKEIGEVMVLSPRTIETHRKNMRRKLGLEKRKGNLRSHLLTFQ